MEERIDAIAQLCREKLNADPFSGYLFIFRTRRGTAIRVLQYDGQPGWPPSACPRDVSNGGQPDVGSTPRAHQAQLLLAAAIPMRKPAAWRPVNS